MRLSTTTILSTAAVGGGAEPRAAVVLNPNYEMHSPTGILLEPASPSVEVACYDVAPVLPGVAADLSHCPTGAKITGHLPSSGAWPPTHDKGLEAAVSGADVIVIPAGVPRKVNPNPNPNP